MNLQDIKQKAAQNAALIVRESISALEESDDLGAYLIHCTELAILRAPNMDNTEGRSPDEAWLGYFAAVSRNIAIETLVTIQRLAKE